MERRSPGSPALADAPGSKVQPARRARRVRASRRWQSNYRSSLAALRVKGLLRGTGRFVGVCCLGLASAIVVLIFAPGGVVGDARYLAVVVAVAMVTAAVLWWCRGWPAERTSLLFVAALDLAYTAVLLTCSNPTVALLGAIWFFLVSDYLMISHGRSALTVHCLWVKVNLLLFGAMAVVSGGPPVDVAATVFLVLTLTATLVLTPLFGRRFADAIRTDSRHSAELAQRDALTQVLNRRGLDEAAPRLFGQALQEDGTVAVLLLDVDQFKAVNDTHGHLRGDAVLALLGERLQRSVRRQTLVARTGGEEFVIVDVVPPDGVHPMAERLRSICDNDNDDIPITVSIGAVGVAASELPTTDPAAMLTALIDRADSAMYLAKAQGGNRVLIDVPNRTRSSMIPAPRAAAEIFDKVVRDRLDGGRLPT